MPAVKLSIEHGQSLEGARSALEAGITRAAARHRFWVRRVEWREDRASADVSGPGYRVRLTVDERQVHVTGNIPVAPERLEGPVRRFIAENLGPGPG